MSDPQAQPSRPAKFPMWRTVGDAFLVMIRNPGPLLAVALIPMAISAGIALLNLKNSGAMPGDLSAVRGSLVLTILLTVVTWLIWSIFAVSWHRFVLLGRRDTGLPVQFQLGKREVTFFLYLMLLMVPVTVPGYVMQLLGDSSAGRAGVGATLSGILVGLAIAIAGLVAWVRCMFIFPAVAVDQTPSLRQAWRMTKGVSWRLFGAVMFASLPGIVVIMALSWGMDLHDPARWTTLSSRGDELTIYILMSQILAFLIGSAGVAVLSLAFQRQTGWSPGTESVAAE